MNERHQVPNSYKLMQTEVLVVSSAVNHDWLNPFTHLSFRLGVHGACL